MMGDNIFSLGERGLHLLFDTATISAAFSEDPSLLRAAIVLHRGELEAVLGEIISIDDANTARTLIAGLAPELRHVLVHLYFEILETRLRTHGRSVH